MDLKQPVFSSQKLGILAIRSPATTTRKELHKTISWLACDQLINAYVFIEQNYYCKSASYKGPFQNSSPDFWNKITSALSLQPLRNR
jgi:hypothetical protein